MVLIMPGLSNFCYLICCEERTTVIDSEHSGHKKTAACASTVSASGKEEEMEYLLSLRDFGSRVTDTAVAFYFNSLLNLMELLVYQSNCE